LWEKIERLLRNLDLDLCLQQTHFIVMSCKWSTKFLYTRFVGDLHMITTGLTRLCLKDNRQMRVMFVCRYCEFEFFYFLMKFVAEWCTCDLLIWKKVQDSLTKASHCLMMWRERSRKIICLHLQFCHRHKEFISSCPQAASLVIHPPQ
jgi:hypothetical protein